MNMKIQFRKTIITLALTVSTMMPIFVYAAPGAGIKPTSVFYFLDTASERISLFFTFNTEKRIKKALAYADERMAEVEAVAGENDSGAVKKAITNYEGNVALATEKSKEIGEQDKAETLFNIIADNTSKHQEVLSAVLVKVPEEAKEAIAHAIEASKKGHEEVLKQITELKKEVVELKQEITDLKKQRMTEIIPPTNRFNIDAQSQSAEIKELKMEIELLKKQQSSSTTTQKRNESITTEITNTPASQSPTPAMLSNDEFRESTILGYAKQAEILRLYLTELRDTFITDIKARRDKLLWRIGIIRKERFPESDSHDGALYNKMLDLYAQEHEREVKFIDQVLTYINYNINLLESYRTEYNTNIASLLSNTQKTFTQEEMASTILRDMHLFYRHFDPKINIEDALGKYYESVVKFEDLYAEEHATILGALSKIGGSSSVNSQVYQPTPQAILPMPEFPKTTRCTMGSSGIVGELTVTCRESSF